MVSGIITFSNTVRAPAISGARDCFDGQFIPPPPWPGLNDLAGRIRFENQAASIPSFRFEAGAPALQGRASNDHARPSLI